MKSFYAYFFLLILLFSCKKENTNIEPIVTKIDTILRKDGKVLTYQKLDRVLVKLKRDKTVYNKNYEDRIAKLVEYYFDKTNLVIVKNQLNNKDAELGYSIEETDWEGENYTQIGLFNRSGSNFATFLWLFYNPKTQQIYEFDVPKNKPILFEYK